MFGLGLLAVLALGLVALLWVTTLLPTKSAKAIFLALVVGGIAFYPFAYRFSSSYTNFLALCELPDRYQVLQTKQVDYVFLDRHVGELCRAGPRVIGRLPYAGFDCIGPSSLTTTATFRYTKKASWSEGCGIECFDSNLTSSPEVSYEIGHRQGYISGSTVRTTYDNGRMGVAEPSGEKLWFSDTLLLDGGTLMAFTRSYTYYPYGNGWAKILGAASGSAPSMRCKNDYLQWNILDVYKPRTGA